MERKDLYTNEIKSIDELENYLNLIISIDKQSQESDVINQLNNARTKNEHVWVLYGKKGDRWECLQVGVTDNVKEEIKLDIEFMFNHTYSDLIKNNETSWKNTQFYINVYQSDADKRKYIYSKIKEDYDEIGFYCLDVDKYLNFEEDKSGNPNLINIIDIAKYWYAEAMFAYETQAIYWNAYRSGVDMKSLLKIQERDNK